MGGDSVSALAAGCPVVVFALGDLEYAGAAPATIRARVATTVVSRESSGCPGWALTGADALRDPRVKAAAFTGSTQGGRHLRLH
ncbi:hypothetical protein ABTY63_27845 [Streptomyces solisilvae]|uniref:hypothetical protein n=1 Tax=Streptomyces malaysiensis TaxID=92644 RepID=UPI00332BD2FB